MLNLFTLTALYERVFLYMYVYDWLDLVRLTKILSFSKLIKMSQKDPATVIRTRDLRWK